MFLHPEFIPRKDVFTFKSIFICLIVFVTQVLLPCWGQDGASKVDRQGITESGWRTNANGSVCYDDCDDYHCKDVRGYALPLTHILKLVVLRCDG